MSDHKEIAQRVVEVFSIIDKGTLTDSRHKDTILQISAGIVSDCLMREERDAVRLEHADIYIRQKTATEINADACADSVISDAPEAEAPKAKKGKKAKSEPETQVSDTVPSAEADEEALF